MTLNIFFTVYIWDNRIYLDVQTHFSSFVSSHMQVLYPSYAKASCVLRDIPYNTNNFYYSSSSAVLFFRGLSTRGLVDCRNKILRRSGERTNYLTGFTYFGRKEVQWAKHIPLRCKCLSVRRACTYNLSRLPHRFFAIIALAERERERGDGLRFYYMYIRHACVISPRTSSWSFVFILPVYRNPPGQW